MAADLASRAAELDAADPLAFFRARFLISDPDLIYLDGNSLGRLPLAAARAVERTLNLEWGERLVRAWGEGWMDLPRRIGGKIAGLIGAAEDEVIVCDSTSVNLYKLAGAAVASQPARSKILTEAGNFHSDLYVLESCAGHFRRHLHIVDDDARVIDAIDEDTALVALSHVSYRSGAILEMAEINRLARERGALTLWDLSHSAGAIPVDLRADGVDLAVGCSYKYLNGGPGAPAFLYVRRELQERLLNPIQGWLGHARSFEFSPEFTPAAGIARFQIGTPPLLSLAAIEAGVDLLLEASMAAVRKKSVSLTQLLLDGFDRHLADRGFTLRSPRSAERRGSHISLGHPHAWQINQALIAEERLIPDYRAPATDETGVLRLGLAPLYNTHAEVAEAVSRIARVVDRGEFRNYSGAPIGVT